MREYITRLAFSTVIKKCIIGAMGSESKIDVIVVGAGSSGIASAIEIARAGKRVVVLERTDFFGSKNMFGGAVYLTSIKDLFPKTWQDAPYESYVSRHSYSFLTKNAATEISHKSTKESNCATVFRPKFDSWMAKEAKKEGVIFAPNTVVRKLIMDGKKVIGVRTDLEDFFAPLTIIADGVQSNLAQQIGLKKELKSANLVLGVKETLKLKKEIIHERFNLDGNEGCVCQFFGGLSDFEEPARGKKSQKPPFALAFLYTFKNHISIGLGVSLKDLADLKLKPYELLEKLKSHPSILPLIKDAQTIEYSAHTIPEGGYRDLAKLFTDGALVVGDAAGLVNNIHFEGTNLAIYSGIYAGRTAVEAINKGDYSKKTLSQYKKMLDKSFVMRDLKSYKNIIKMAENRASSIFNFYPQKMDEFFTIFNAANSVPKAQQYRKFTKSFLFGRNIVELLTDVLQFAKSFFEVLK